MLERNVTLVSAQCHARSGANPCSDSEHMGMTGLLMCTTAAMQGRCACLCGKQCNVVVHLHGTSSDLNDQGLNRSDRECWLWVGVLCCFELAIDMQCLAMSCAYAAEQCGAPALWFGLGSLCQQLRSQIQQPMCTIHGEIGRLPQSVAVAAYTALAHHCQHTVTLTLKRETEAPLPQGAFDTLRIPRPTPPWPCSTLFPTPQPLNITPPPCSQPA